MSTEQIRTQDSPGASVPVPDVVGAEAAAGELPPAQGWYLDPFGKHDQRWFSSGEPTSLVRDAAGTEADDAPPPGVTTPPVDELTRGPETQLSDGADLLRADHAITDETQSAQSALDGTGLWSGAAD